MHCWRRYYAPVWPIIARRTTTSTDYGAFPPMNTYQCTCGGRLFFNNTICIGCGHEVGWCEACSSVVPLEKLDDGTYRCGNPKCGLAVVKCHNYAVEAVCNRVFASRAADSVTPVASSAARRSFSPPALPNPLEVSESELCKACRLNDVIPDLTVEGNRERWAKLETAKRRLLFQLDELGLRYAAEDVGDEKPLQFDFKANTPEAAVLTGHADGLITINVSEADSVERERVRKQMHEPHRSLLGHMRHEVGHYYWMTLVEGKREDECMAVFGDHRELPYADALKLYYENGPAADWQSQYVRAYATAHPWEDFAETWGFYLDMLEVLSTMHHHLHALAPDPRALPAEALTVIYQQLGVFFNEVNRTMGLKDLVPEIISPEIVKKLAFLDRLVARISSQS